MSERNGARFEVRLEQEGGGRAEYTARFEWENSATELSVTVDGNRGISPADAVIWPPQSIAQVPDWIVKYATVALRGAARTSLEEGWPRRLTRWRAAPATRSPEPESTRSDND